MSEKDPTSPQKFGIRHALALLFAVGVTLGIFVFREQLQNLDELAYLGAFLAMLVGNATVILPVPGLIIVFVLGATLNPFILALVAGPGAALGEMTGYAAGFGGSAAIDDFALYQRIQGWMDDYGLWVIFVLAIIPNPAFDMAGIVAGAMRVRWWQFFLVAWAGKTLQALLIALAGAYSIGWVESLLA